MGPSRVAYLKGIYARAKAADKVSSMHVEHHGGVHLLGHAPERGAATDAEFQNRIIMRDNTLSLFVVARQPHPNPNFAPHAAARPAAAAAARRGA